MKNKNKTDFTDEFLKMIVPPEWTSLFDLTDLKEKRTEWNLILVEKPDLVPKEIKNEFSVLNGYFKPLELMAFPARGKPVYIKILRRKWKKQGGRESFFNTYDLHYPGVKAIKPLADFLKELDRKSLDEFYDSWPMYRDLWEEDTSLVQRVFKWFQRRR